MSGSIVMADLAIQINAEHNAATEQARSAVQHARRAGELLLQAKEQIAHGQWLPWLKTNCPDLSVRTTQAYTRLARECLADPAKAQRVAGLSLRDALVELASSKPTLTVARWLPDGAVMLTAAVEPCGVADGGTLFVQQSAHNPGYYHMVMLFDPTYPGENGGIHGMRRPVLADAATDCFCHIFKRKPSSITWNRRDAQAGHLDQLVAQYLPAPWLVRSKRNESVSAS